MTHYVYVQSMDGTPLMPTTRYGKVRRMLKSGQAKVVRDVPFTIRLCYRPKTDVVDPILLGEDPGRTNIGLSAVDIRTGRCLLLIHLATINKDIPERMRKRKIHRQSSRRGERLRRKRRAIKNGTTLMQFIDSPMGLRMLACYDKRNNEFRPCLKRYLPQYKKPVVPRDITNTEAKYSNRKREAGWLTPTATQLWRTHLNVIKLVCQILPVSAVCLEVNKFAFMALENPNARGIDFQNGALKGFSGVGEAVSAMQGGKCLYCRKHAIEHNHHMKPRSQGGADTIDNVVGLCNDCHDLIHTDTDAKGKLAKMHGARNKKHGAASVLNQIIPKLTNSLVGMFPGNTYVTTGYNTKVIRDSFGLEKTHDLDAYCIAMSPLRGTGVQLSEDFPVTHEMQQFRRHNRARIHAQRERAYKIGKETVAKNRHKRMAQVDGKEKEQVFDSLAEWRQKQTALYGEARTRKTLSTIKVLKSIRIYNPTERVFSPGDTVFYQGKRYLVKGQKDKGLYLQFYGCGKENFPSEECTMLYKNAGLAFVS